MVNIGFWLRGLRAKLLLLVAVPIVLLTIVSLISNPEARLYTSLALGICFFAFGVFFTSRLASVFTAVTQKLSQSSVEVSTASNQLSNASQSLSSGATEAAASLEETVSSLQELSGMVKQNADNSKEAGNLSQKCRTSAEEGEQEIKKLIEAMTDISHSSKKIEEIINVIDDIAFQTNLLALNAAVEAARAGDQGRGFAVVAEAVRNLAQRSASAAKEITSLIKDSVSKIDRGSKIADLSGSVLKEIVTSVKKVADLNNEIAMASQEQATGITEISKTMNQLDQSTQANAASAAEASASSDEMSVQADALQELVGELAFVVDGDTSARRIVRLRNHAASGTTQGFGPQTQSGVRKGASDSHYKLAS